MTISYNRIQPCPIQIRAGPQCSAQVEPCSAHICQSGDNVPPHIQRNRKLFGRLKPSTLGYDKARVEHCQTRLTRRPTANTAVAACGRSLWCDRLCRGWKNRECLVARMPLTRCSSNADNLTARLSKVVVRAVLTCLSRDYAAGLNRTGTLHWTVDFSIVVRNPCRDGSWRSELGRHWLSAVATRS